MSENEELEMINNLLACSERNDLHEKNVSVHLWDEVRSWKPVSPMGIYAKPKKKSMKNKKNLPVLKDVRYTTTISGDTLPYRYRFYDNGKAAHSSTNVLSYDTPSWRYIIDWKTYGYLDRVEPEDKENCRGRTKRTHSWATSIYQREQSEYHMYKINPTDVIDDKIFAAYKESLTYVVSNFEERGSRKHFLILQPASLGDGKNFADDECIGEKKLITMKDMKDNTTRNDNNKNCKEGSNKSKKRINKRKKRNSHKCRGSVVKQKSSLPPIPTQNGYKVSGYNNESAHAFPFSIAQLLKRKNCCEVSENHQKVIGREKSEKLESSPVNQSYDFYLPTLKYGNYIHLFNDESNEAKVKGK